MSNPYSALTSPLSRARGLGSARHGTGHWVWQRITAVVMLPLIVWFLFSFLSVFVGASRSTAAEWFASPLNSLLLLALLCAMFYHSKLGLQVVIEDYVDCPAAKTILILACNIVAFFLALISAMAIVKLHVMGI